MRSLSDAITAAKNAWDQPSPWLWLLEVERDNWWMLRYTNQYASFQDGATLTSALGGTGTIVANVPTGRGKLFGQAYEGPALQGFLILSDTSSSGFVAGEEIHDDGGGTGVVLEDLDTSSDDPVIFRFVRNTESIFYEYETQTYDAFPFTIGAAAFAKGQFRSVDISLSNALRIAEAFVRKADGLLKARVKVKIVWAGDLTAAPAFEEQYTVKKSAVNHEVVTVTCGQQNFLLKAFPRYRYSRKRCRWRFKSDSCGYSGARTSCNRLLDGCIASSNTSRFGGFPAIPGGFFSA